MLIAGSGGVVVTNGKLCRDPAIIAERLIGRIRRGSFLDGSSRRIAWSFRSIVLPAGDRTRSWMWGCSTWNTGADGVFDRAVLGMAKLKKQNNPATPIARSPVSAGASGSDVASLVRQVDLLSARLADLQATLDHQERLATLGTIAGMIAHEFNNILTPVCSYAQMALDSPDDAALARKALERSLTGAERAAKIAGAILVRRAV